MVLRNPYSVRIAQHHRLRGANEPFGSTGTHKMRATEDGRSEGFWPEMGAPRHATRPERTGLATERPEQDITPQRNGKGVGRCLVVSQELTHPNVNA